VVGFGDDKGSEARSVLLALPFGEPTGQSWLQIGELGVALVLSAAIGLERELRQKSAGLRTHTLIGFGAALFMLVSKYGFTDVLGDHVVLDPSRVAAQIVSGIGFIGGGLIFVRRDAVRGLTTAAAVWLTTAVGMAAGAGLPVLAAVATVGYFVVVFAFPLLTVRLAGSRQQSRFIQVTYEDGRGLLRDIVSTCTRRGWTIAELSTRHVEREPVDALVDGGPGRRLATGVRPVSVLLELRGAADQEELVTDLNNLHGVLSVAASNPDLDPDA
jgi:putative Mg2+ transporter-C (MgtC) family protein